VLSHVGFLFGRWTTVNALGVDFPRIARMDATDATAWFDF
jgi:hypothetical protein